MLLTWSKYLMSVIRMLLKSTGTRSATYWSSISAQIQALSTNMRKIYCTLYTVPFITLRHFKHRASVTGVPKNFERAVDIVISSRQKMNMLLSVIESQSLLLSVVDSKYTCYSQQQIGNKCCYQQQIANEYFAISSRQQMTVVPSSVEGNCYQQQIANEHVSISSRQ